MRPPRSVIGKGLKIWLPKRVVTEGVDASSLDRQFYVGRTSPASSVYRRLKQMESIIDRTIIVIDSAIKSRPNTECVHLRRMFRQMPAGLSYARVVSFGAKTLMWGLADLAESTDLAMSI